MIRKYAPGSGAPPVRVSPCVQSTTIPWVSVLSEMNLTVPMAE
jgi:hypothetical protein